MKLKSFTNVSDFLYIISYYIIYIIQKNLVLGLKENREIGGSCVFFKLGGREGSCVFLRGIFDN